MPLDYTTTQPLDLQGVEYNDDDLAVLMLAGDRYGGEWFVEAQTPDGATIGQYRTHIDDGRNTDLRDDPRYPYLAVESGFIWLRDQLAHLGVQLLDFECLNHHYDTAFFCAARFVVAGETFEPIAGVDYADQWTLDYAMAVRS